MSLRAFVIFVVAWALALWLATTNMGEFFGYLWTITLAIGLAVVGHSVGWQPWVLQAIVVLWVALPIFLMGLGLYHAIRNRDWWLARASWAGAVAVSAFPAIVWLSIRAAHAAWPY